jgi:hypothetical protein
MMTLARLQDALGPKARCKLRFQSDSGWTLVAVLGDGTVWASKVPSDASPEEFDRLFVRCIEAIGPKN